MAKRKPKRAKSTEQLQEEGRERLRQAMISAGVPSHRVAGDRIDEFKSDTFADLKERRQIIRLIYPSTVDQWLAEGGTGFDEPQRRAINHCRELWNAIGSQGKLVANFDSLRCGGGPRDQMWEHAEAFGQLAEYEREIPRAYWMVFEAIVRNEEPPSRAAKHLARHPVQAIADARRCVGFCASLIAQWRGY